MLSLCWSIGQGQPSVGTLNAINFNKSLKGGWGLNFKWESRQLWRDGNLIGMQPGTTPRYILSDFSLLAAKKTTLSQSWAAGYLLRFPMGKPVHRTIQQLALINRRSSLRIAHRFVFDQTFSERDPVSFRLRYRISFEIPLSGNQVDRGEFYLKVNHELLNRFQGNSYEPEFRSVPVLGYPFSDKNKLEAGFDYRLDGFWEGQARHRLWVVLAWYVKR